ncbi:MAG: response regulator [Acidobacteria bacterium]|nr:response regulator [Acidobacteriota bacterium]MBI3423134.1 response regulator [Acidobacteriota bacterium]
MIQSIVTLPVEPEFPELALARRGFQMMKADDPGDRLFWQQVAEREPANEIAWMRLAMLAENDQQAIGYLRRVLEINPQNEQALIRLHQALLNEGATLAREGNKSRARWLLMEASALNPQSEEAWLRLAEVAEKSADSIRCLQRVLKLNPQNVEAIAKLNQTYALQANFAPAVKTWQCPLCAAAFQVELTTCASCRAILNLNDLEAVLANKDVDREVLLNAIRHYQNLTESVDDFHAYYYLGVAYLHLQQLPEAVQALRKASLLRADELHLKAQLIVLEQRQTEAQARVVLVIDDSATIRKLVSITLQKQGHRVLEAAEMMEALAKLNEATPDMILLDICLPGMDGYQICKIIKAYPSTKDVPVVMLSGKDGFFDKVRARLVGAQGYLTKPVVPNDLLKAVENYCGVEK